MVYVPFYQVMLRKSLGKKVWCLIMLFVICQCMSRTPKFWHMYVITYSNFPVILEPSIIRNTVTFLLSYLPLFSWCWGSVPHPGVFWAYHFLEVKDWIVLQEKKCYNNFFGCPYCSNDTKIHLVVALGIYLHDLMGAKCHDDDVFALTLPLVLSWKHHMTL